jgi:hypothetical protein
MATNYANEKLTTAIKNHLLSVDVIPPTTDVSKLARDLAQVCLTELYTAGLSRQAAERLFTPLTFKTGAPGVV